MATAESDEPRIGLVLDRVGECRLHDEVDHFCLTFGWGTGWAKLG
jgi:hypothetical protein